MRNVLKMSEAELRARVEPRLLNEIDPRVPLKPNGSGAREGEVKVGAFTLDLLAENVAGGMTIVEYKVNAAKDTLAQLLLYPRAVEVALGRNCPKLRVVLVTTHLDKGVVNLARSIRSPWPIVFRVYRDGHLVYPSALQDKAERQYWEQATSGTVQLAWDGKLAVKGKPWGPQPEPIATLTSRASTLPRRAANLRSR